MYRVRHIFLISDIIPKTVMHWAIWYHLYNLKNVKNSHRGVLLLVKLQALASKFFFYLFEIVQIVTTCATHHYRKPANYNQYY